MIGIYLDASRKIGMGHLKRCITLSKVFPSKKTIFFTRSKNLNRTLSKENISYYIIKSKVKFIKLIKEKKIKIFIFDVRKFDNFLKDIFFLNYNTKHIFTVLIANSLKYIKGPKLVFFPVSVKKKPKKDKIYAGEKYVVLSKTTTRDKIKSLKRIMISMGGSDPQNITIKVLKILNKLNVKIRLNIVIGKFSEIKTETIKKIMTNNSIKYKLYINPKNLKKIMKLNDLLITNSGITKFEATQVKLPSIIISNDKETIGNQIAFSKKKTSIYFGYYKSKKILKLNSLIYSLYKNPKELVKMQNRSKNLLDHLGALRIKKIINKKSKLN